MSLSMSKSKLSADPSYSFEYCFLKTVLRVTLAIWFEIVQHCVSAGRTKVHSAQWSVHWPSTAPMTGSLIVFLSNCLFLCHCALTFPPPLPRLSLSLSLSLFLSPSVSLVHAPTVRYLNKLLSLSLRACCAASDASVCGSLQDDGFKMRKESRLIRWIWWIVVVTALFFLGFIIGKRTKFYTA